MLEREYIIERIKSLPEESLKEIIDFIEFLEAKRRISVEERKEEGDPLTKVKESMKAPLIWRRDTINMSMGTNKNWR